MSVATRARIGKSVAKAEDIAILSELEAAVVGYARDADYPWLLREREGASTDAAIESSVLLSSVKQGSALSLRSIHPNGPLNLFMSNRPFGDFDRFITFGPPIVL